LGDEIPLLGIWTIYRQHTEQLALLNTLGNASRGGLNRLFVFCE
jgi:hypothetical protein